MDLIWDGTRLFVAGPDTRARWHSSGPDTSYTGLRFSRGLGPALLDVRADELRDRSPKLHDLWPDGEARMLSEQVAADPAGALERWLVKQADHRQPDRLGGAVFDLAAGGASVTDMAGQLSVGVRRLHRRCLPLFGYGPQRLRRILRLERALALGRNATPLTQVAVAAGFADQAHLSREVRDFVGTSPARLLGELES